jgi:hypothetical protein
MDSSDDKLILFESRPKPIRQISRMPGSAQCKHLKLLLDHGGRTLACEDCGSVLDPYDHLLRIVELGERIDQRYQEVKRQVDYEETRTQKLRRDAEKLKRETENLRTNLANLERQARQRGVAEGEIAKMRERLK